MRGPGGGSIGGKMVKNQGMLCEKKRSFCERKKISSEMII